MITLPSANAGLPTTLPSGTVTFLFTDIEGSTKLWDAHPEKMRIALARHDALLRQAIESNEGVVFKTIGDAFCAVFQSASNAATATIAIQNCLALEPWPDPLKIRVRIALHTGVAQERDNDYFGPVLNRVARLLGTGHGGQSLISSTCYEHIHDWLPENVGLRDLGICRLKDLERPERIYALTHPELPDDFPPLRSLDAVPNNLPQQLTSFIGREAEMMRVRTLLTETRLLTLIGSGGCGKTRLSLQVAAHILEDYSDGVYLVELAPIIEATLVVQTVITALRIKEVAGQSLQESLLEYCKARHLLLVLDNCEHLINACADLAMVLLRTCPHVRILATSREPLNIRGETTYRVPSLSLPNPKDNAMTTVQNLSRFESVRLFLERVVSVKPDFTITGANAPAVAQLCYRLDGIPLALELGAARVRSLSVEEINDRLDNRFRLLTMGDRAALPRQQTLRALVNWSHDLLNEAEKRLFARLSVFVGGWTLAAAESICTFAPLEEEEVLDLLSGLVDKSLVLADTESDGTTRYRMLETLRQYAAEKREANGETTMLRRRHRDWLLEWAEEIAPRLIGHEQITWLTHLETEFDNLRAALDFCVTDADSTTQGLRLASSLWRFWSVRGYLTEGRNWFDLVLARKGEPGVDSATLALTINRAGILAYYQNDNKTARLLYEESIALFRKLDDKRMISTLLNNLGNIVVEEGNFIQARALYEQSLELKRWLGDKRGIATALNNIANIDHQQGDYLTAQTLLKESLAIKQEFGDRVGIASSLINLGNIAYLQEDFPAAITYCQDGLSLYRELEDKVGMANAMHTLAVVFLGEGNGDATRSVFLWGATDTLLKSIGTNGSVDKESDYKKQARSRLGEEAFATAFSEGARLNWEEAVRFALGEERNR